MKTIEELRKEQAETKKKLVEVIELINSEEFYTLSPSEKNLIGQQRIGVEICLNSLTKLIYDREGCTLDMSNAMWPLLMSNMFSNSFSSSSSVDPLKKNLDEKDFDLKPEKDESGHDD